MPKTILTPKAEIIFITHHFREEENVCWPWLGSTNKKDGYGQLSYMINYQRTYYLAHRISYLYYNKLKEIDDSILICHSCDNRSCVNPNHLFIGSRSDGVRFSYQGEGNTNSKLTENIVKEIRREVAQGISQRSLAIKHNVSHQLISDIVNYKTWRHI